jgi:OmpA-OmpF porin, OOP family
LFYGTSFAAPGGPCRPDPVGAAIFFNVFHKETRMEKRILAVLIAALSGGAYAQSTYVTSGAGGTVVTNGFGQCWQSGSAGGSASAVACPPAGAGQSTAMTAQRTQVAQADRNARTTEAPSRAGDKSTAPQAAGATTSAANPPPAPGYVGSGAGVVATNPFGLCWRAGSDWSPDKAAAPCDAVPRAAVAPVPVVKAEPPPAPAPLAAAAPTPAPQPIVIEKITLSTDVLFGFNKAELTPAGQQKLDDLAKSAQGANVERVVLTGHADRIGSEGYNQELSEQRAQAVADYLKSKGVDSSRLQVAGKGESEPVTGDQCKRLGAESNKNQKLIACLQPDRRVDAELLGSREQTAGSPPATGASGTSSGTTSGSSSFSGSSGGARSGSASGSSSSESGSTNK